MLNPFLSCVTFVLTTFIKIRSWMDFDEWSYYYYFPVPNKHINTPSNSKRDTLIPFFYSCMTQVILTLIKRIARFITVQTLMGDGRVMIVCTIYFSFFFLFLMKLIHVFQSYYVFCVAILVSVLILHELMNVSNFYLKANTHFLLRNQFLNKKYTNLWKLWNLYACSKCQIRNFRVTFMRY